MGKWDHWDLKANSRMAAQRARDKVTKQIVKASKLLEDHGDRFWSNHKEHNEYMRIHRALARFRLHCEGHDVDKLLGDD